MELTYIGELFEQATAVTVHKILVRFESSRSDIASVQYKQTLLWRLQQRTLDRPCAAGDKIGVRMRHILVGMWLRMLGAVTANHCVNVGASRTRPSKAWTSSMPSTPQAVCKAGRPPLSFAHTHTKEKMRERNTRSPSPCTTFTGGNT